MALGLRLRQMSSSFPIELKTATSPGSVVVISAVPAELCTQKKPGRERAGRKGHAWHAVTLL